MEWQVMELSCVNRRVHISNQKFIILEHQLPSILPLLKQFDHVLTVWGRGRVQADQFLFVSLDDAVQQLVSTGVPSSTVLLEPKLAQPGELVEVVDQGTLIISSLSKAREISFTVIRLVDRCWSLTLFLLKLITPFDNESLTTLLSELLHRLDVDDCRRINDYVLVLLLIRNLRVVEALIIVLEGDALDIIEIFWSVGTALFLEGPCFIYHAHCSAEVNCRPVECLVFLPWAAIDAFFSLHSFFVVFLGGCANNFNIDLVLGCLTLDKLQFSRENGGWVYFP